MRNSRSRMVKALLFLVVLLFARLVQATPLSSESASRHNHDPGPTQAQQPGQSATLARELGTHISAHGRTDTRPYASYVKVSDDLDKITLEIPTAWNDIDSGPWLYGGKEIGRFIAASANLQNFYATKMEPGVFIGASRQLTHVYDLAGLLDLEQASFKSSCKLKDRRVYRDLFYMGSYDTYIDCVKGRHNLIVVAATTPDHRVMVLLRIIVVSNADLDAAARIFQTFQTLGNPEVHDDHGDH